ncbi:hypothetical protein KAW18_14795, partial [candidate division WOR-3 bacterium]|nr:hypothetical protein [candidate division WOR-3 bacterium]
MSKSKVKIDDKQMSIFEYLQSLSAQSPLKTSPEEGQYKVIDPLRASLRAAIKDCPLSRPQIAGEMSHLAGESITKEMINSWTRESDEINGRPGRHVPAEYLPAFCKAVGCNEPLVILGKIVGLFVLPGPEALRAEIQKINEQIKNAQANKRKRMLFLQEMERNVD